MPNIAEAVLSIVSADLPVLFVDTCSLLDVIRAPIRPDKLQGCIESAVELLHLASSTPTRCILVAASFVRGEWNDHAAPAAEELRKHLVKLDTQAACFHDACGFIALTPSFGRPSYGTIGLGDRLLDLSKQLLDRAIHLDPQDDTNMRAFKRAATNTPPSRKGGEIKDSTITEESLEVCRQLQAAGFTKKRIFCTSNTDDYCEAGPLHPRLAVDFAAVGLGFATNLPWAVHEIES